MYTTMYSDNRTCYIEVRQIKAKRRRETRNLIRCFFARKNKKKNRFFSYLCPLKQEHITQKNTAL